MRINNVTAKESILLQYMLKYLAIEDILGNFYLLTYLLIIDCVLMNF